MSSLLLIPLMSFMFSMLSFMINNSHFLMSLLCLEAMMLSLLIFVPQISTNMMIPTPTISLILLTFGACEASMGLSILVKMSRHYGSDMLSNMSINKC